MEGTAGQGRAALKEISDAGVDLDDAFQVLEDEGVEKFIVSWKELQETVRSALR